MLRHDSISPMFDRSIAYNGDLSPQTNGSASKQHRFDNSVKKLSQQPKHHENSREQTVENSSKIGEFGPRPSALERRVLAPRMSALEARSAPHMQQLQSPVTNLKRLFVDHIDDDVQRCVQGWKVISENEWRNGLLVHDIGPVLKEWIQLCIRGIVQYSEMMNHIPADKIDQTMTGTENVLKSTIQMTTKGRDTNTTLKEYLLKETVLFRNMNGDQFHSSLKDVQFTERRMSEVSSFENSARHDEQNHETYHSSTEENDVKTFELYENENQFSEDEYNHDSFIQEEEAVDREQRQEIENEIISRSTTILDNDTITTKGNPFYQILKEFIELCCVPLQYVKSSDKLLKEKKNAELLELLGYICINTVQWKTIILRTLRAIIFLFHQNNFEQDNTSLPMIEIQNHYLSHSKLLGYICTAFDMFKGNSVSFQSPTSSLEYILSPKEVDILTEFLVLFSSFSTLWEGAVALSSGTFLRSLVQFVETTTLVREENVPQYVHMTIEILYNIVSQLSSGKQMDTKSQNDKEDIENHNRVVLEPLQTAPILPKSIDGLSKSDFAFSIQPKVILSPLQVTTILTYLLQLLDQLHRTATKQTDNYLKNDILAIALLLSYPSIYKPHFKDVGFNSYICRYFQAEIDNEPNNSHIISSPSKYSPPQYESEMVLLMWSLLTSVAFHGPSLQQLVDEGLIAILLNYVDITCKYMHCISKWSEDQIKDIRLQALRSLFFFSSMSPENFCANAGCETLVEFLASLYQVDEQGESELDDPETYAILNKIASILVNISSTEAGCQELTEKGCFTQLFDMTMKGQTSEDGSIYIKRKMDYFEIVTRIVLNNKANLQIVHQINGVQRLHKSLLEFYSQQDNCSKQERDELLYLHLKTLWACTVGFEENEIQFILEEGVKTLLDLLDNSIDFIQYTCLGFLGDILHHEDAITHFNNWISQTTKKSATSRLVHLWTEECSQRANSKKRDAELWERFVCKRSDLDFKLRIHIVLSLVNFEDRCTHANATKLNDKIVLCDISTYGEALKHLAWRRVANELEEEGVHPTSPDCDILEEHNVEYSKVEEDVRARKSSIKAVQEQHDQEREAEFFGYIKGIVNSKAQELKLVQNRYSVMEQKRKKDQLRVKEQI